MAASSATDPRVILLDPTDNVCVACADLERGTELMVEGAPLTVGTRVRLGHKLAVRDITAGETILKYGAPIGVATQGIARGEHVHLHNARSNYMPTYTLDGTNPYVKGSS